MVKRARTIAVGDIHGCLTAMLSLIDLLQLSENDTLVVLGDCVDRGPSSCDVIEHLIDLTKRCRVICLLGNHEQMMLEHYRGEAGSERWIPFGGEATLRSYDASGAETWASHIEYISTWPDYLETDSHVFMHASYLPLVPWYLQPWNECRWKWMRDEIPPQHESGKIAVVGHTAQRSGNVLDAKHLVCIDTNCYGGGYLTAYEPSTGEIWQVDSQGRSRDVSSIAETTQG
jgi:serine/threonine protein phosphatase 1